MRRREEDLQRKRDEKRRLEDEARAVGEETSWFVGRLVGWLVGSPFRRQNWIKSPICRHSFFIENCKRKEGSLVDHTESYTFF